MRYQFWIAAINFEPGAAAAIVVTEMTAQSEKPREALCHGLRGVLVLACASGIATWGVRPF